MTKAEKETWIINLEDLSSRIDSETVKFVCGKYGAKSIYDLSPIDYQEVWNELFDCERDAND